MQQYASRFNIPLLAIPLLIAGACAPNESSSNNAEAPAIHTPQLTEVWTLNTGLDRPESVIYDAAREVLYVTNIVGDGAAMDGNGYIARVSPAGEMIDQRWIPDLNGPKGIAIDGDQLWASDINALVEIDLNAGQVTHRYAVDGDVYLNDVAVQPGGAVFVTDSRNSKIYRFADGKLEVWLEDERIQMPNGAHIIGDELVVVAGDGASENPGQARYFKAISLMDKRIRVLDGSVPDGALDAVEPDERGGIFTTDWAGGRLMYFNEGTGTTLLQQLGQGAADVDYIAETKMLYVPVMVDGLLIAYRVE